MSNPDLELRVGAARVHQSLGALIEHMQRHDGPPPTGNLRSVGVALTRLGIDMIDRADTLNREATHG